ncbi:transporter [Pseudomonas sp. CDFA 602]|uniref:SphA family protein n=1 Tax=Pseudomonas californiensis TaxID=2829823 RepID=UPI001E381540|nr:transporter [Pseudomonas californiensis]MCD5996427.1 transporter [Pseudomonas californiensis]MCD6002026.1 transporter [Pseudomonas californiensis]
MNIRTSARAAVVLSFTLWGSTSQAIESGVPTTAYGVYDFGAGFLPPPTPNGTIAGRSAFYKTTLQKDGRGKDTGNDISVSVLSFSLAYLRMTDATFLGANYGFGAVAPFFKMNGDLKVNAGGQTVFETHSDLFRQADLQLLPVMLQWHVAPNAGINAQLQIQAPTGDYDKNRFMNSGVNHWTFSPILNGTWISEHGLEVSSSFQLDFNTRNPDTDYKSGVEYRHEFAIGQHASDWTVGLGGYYYHQISDDNAASLENGNRAKVLAVGPAISYFKPGNLPVWFHIYKEFDAENRSQGYTAAVRLAHSF